jgi:hypothetical protein
MEEKSEGSRETAQSVESIDSAFPSGDIACKSCDFASPCRHPKTGCKLHKDMANQGSQISPLHMRSSEQKADLEQGCLPRLKRA